MNEDTALQDKILSMVIDFASQWNVIETDIRNQMDAEEAIILQKNDGVYDHYAPRTDWFSLLNEQISPLIDHFCTEKPRIYGGKTQRSFGFPSKFNGIETAEKTAVEIKSKSRIEVYFKTTTMFDDEYLFVVLKKAGEWKIDGYKNRRYHKEKWDNQIL
ncbi:NTF2 fold immunity protein [Commensalibacter communis]|uniref:NTF2 fold immunity protein n=1 Tax=Commensalibacter communis TaxID=2972786 RepID=UPI0022FF8867|nr:NTF2 fold immunity protein [Commensalibacter communis]CAI3952290.1 unnamed protein product [Commensalibacter communis]CAI3954140.1 unnamed protein product [Commensalibacter communis]